MVDNIDEKLINSVFNYEILYDLGNQYYYDTARKENAWEEIAKNVGMSVQAAKKRWNALRGCYRKALNRKKTASGQKAVHIAPWKYEEQMSFLKAHVSQKRPQRSNMDDTATYDENPGAETDGDGASGDITSHETQEEEDNAQLLSFDNSTVPKPRKETEGAPIKKKQCTPKPSAHDIISTYFENKKSARDHLTSYFKMVEDTVRTFTPLQQVEIKSRFSSILTEYEYKNLRSAEERSHLRSTSTTFPGNSAAAVYSPSPSFPSYSSTPVPSPSPTCQGYYSSTPVPSPSPTCQGYYSSTPVPPQTPSVSGNDTDGPQEQFTYT